jgi:hypothetical protein
MTFVFQFMLMLVSLYGLKTRPAGAVPVEPPELEPLDEPPLDEPLEDPPDEPPLELPLLDPLPLPPGHTVPPGSHPVPQLTVWHVYPCPSLVVVQPHDSPRRPSHALALLPM